MKKLLTLLVLSCLIFSCSTSKKATNQAQTESTSIAAGQDGSSYEKAIVINKKKSGEGIKAEYDWLKNNYPGYKLKSQSLQTQGKKIYDVLTIITANGKKKEVYFDITNFFGKY